MARSDLLASLGILVWREFLDAAVCERLLTELTGAGRVSAEVTDKERDYVNPDFRRSSVIAAPSDSLTAFQSSLLAAKPRLDSHFGLSLEGCEKPQFLVYQTGDFFRRHSDGSQNTNERASIQARKISVVVFLNPHRDEPFPGAYGGGELAFYGLLADPRLREYGIPLAGEAGMLVAFRSSVVHEVRPVAHGERCVGITWFY